jgi:hypothetical protein
MDQKLYNADLSPAILDFEFLISETGIEENDLLKILSQQIEFLLEKQYEKLRQTLYRLDVNEQKVQLIFTTFKPEQWAENLAILILEREKQRIFWRKKYSN